MNTHQKNFLLLAPIGFLLLNSLAFIKPQTTQQSNLDNSVEIAQAKRKSSSKWKQKEIIITVWNSTEPDSSVYSNLARENYNSIPVFGSLKGLDAAEKNKLKVIFGDSLIGWPSLRNPATLKKLDALIEELKKKSALEAYHITDEPTANDFSKYAEIVSYLRKKDPTKLTYINLFPLYATEEQLGVSAGSVDRSRIKYPGHLHGISSKNKATIAYLDYLRQFVDVVKPDIISYDHYHLYEKAEGSEYFLNLELISQVSKEKKIPFMSVIQSSRFLKFWRLPTAKEIRFQVYSTLAYGGKGISYFTYWGSEKEEGLYRNGRQTQLAKDVAAINSEIRKLSPTLLAFNSQGTYHSQPLPVGSEAIPKKSPIQVLSQGEFILGLFGNGKITNAFMIANRNYRRKQRAELKIEIAGSKLQELNRKTGEWKQISSITNNRKVTLDIDAGDGRLFRVI
jgi:hypothetical protein